MTDTAIRGAIADGAADPMAVGQRCGAGVNCGGCLPRVCALLAESGHETDGVAPCSATGVCLPRLRARSMGAAARIAGDAFVAAPAPA